MLLCSSCFQTTAQLLQCPLSFGVYVWEETLGGSNITGLKWSAPHKQWLIDPNWSEKYLCAQYMHAETTDCLLLQDILGWGESDRGVSYTFGRDIVQEFLETHNLSLICRAHQVNSLVSDSAVPYHRISHCSLYCYVVYNDSLGPRGLRPAVCPLHYMKSRYCKR